jgi:hypothetical protein
MDPQASGCLTKSLSLRKKKTAAISSQQPQPGPSGRKVIHASR